MELAENVASYHVWGADNVMYSAVPLSGLVQWIKDGRVTADQWVFVEHDNQWQKAADIPELQALFRSRLQSGLAVITAASRSLRSLGLRPETLRRMKGFSGMDDRQIESFVRYTEVLHCPQFSHIVSKGERGDAMYLVVEGELRALAMVDGKESTLGTIAAGDTFGEISLIDQGPRSADVLANRDSVLLKISCLAFEQLLREAPSLAVPFLLALSRSVVGRVRTLTSRYEDSVRFIRATTR
ncbi:MAG: cyclic nucleotide-binding domain-containing protein [Verrucomicrobiota bacterium]